MLWYNKNTNIMFTTLKWGIMQNKIITNTDSNLITLQYSELSDQAIIKNELLIKELLFILKSEGKYISKRDLQLIEDSQVLDKQVNDLLAKFKLESLADIETLINNLNNRNLRNSKQAELAALKSQQEIEALKTEYELQIATLQLENKQLSETSKEFERKYHGQKNRKVIKFVDKVAKR